MTSACPPPATSDVTADITSAPTRRPRLILADRGDPVVTAMAAAMEQRFDVVGRVDAELSRAERWLVGATTVRATRRSWVENFYKSGLAVALRSRRARSGLASTEDVAGAADVVFATHGLFDTEDPRTVVYLDCTHRQSMEHWPDWNPLRGRALERWLARERRQYHSAAHVFAFSQVAATSLVEDYDLPEDRVSVVGAGVSYDVLPERAPRLDGPPTVLFVGNDFERKGGPQLLEAFALLRRRIPDARLLIVGTRHRGHDQEGVSHLGRLHDRAALSCLYAEADVFCLPAVFDPFPGVLLEAMAHRLPCVTTAAGGIPEIVVDGTTALVVPPEQDQVAGLADALEVLLADPTEAARLGGNGRRRVENGFRWSHVLDRMAPVLERLAAHPQTPTQTRPTREAH